jgi:hypothetical protein
LFDRRSREYSWLGHHFLTDSDLLRVMLVHSDLLSVVQQVSAKRYDFFFRFESRVEVRIFFSDP